MAQYRSVHTRMWSDPIVEKLSPHARYVFLYLITNPHRNESALYSLTPKKISDETGLPENQVQEALQILIEKQRVLYDYEESVVWVVNAVKYQSLNPNCVKSIYTDVEMCPSQPLVNRFKTVYQGFKGVLEFGSFSKIPNPLETVDKGFVRGPIGIGISNLNNNLSTDSSGKTKFEKKKSKNRKIEEGRIGKTEVLEGVFLTDAERERLAKKYGPEKLGEMIEFLSLQKQTSGYECVSDCAALQKWVSDAVDERNAKRAKQNGKPFRSPGRPVESGMSVLHQRILQSPKK